MKNWEKVNLSPSLASTNDKKVVYTGDERERERAVGREYIIWVYLYELI
jgi:hypothetical protein